MTVSNLIDQQMETWDTNLIHTLFWEDDAKAIMSIPVDTSTAPNIRVWHYTNHGFYSVKIAYFLARHLRRNERR